MRHIIEHIHDSNGAELANPGGDYCVLLQHSNTLLKDEEPASVQDTTAHHLGNAALQETLAIVRSKAQQNGKI